MNGTVVETERETAVIDRRSAVDVASVSRWTPNTDRLSAFPTSSASTASTASTATDRSSLLRAHAAKSVECAPASPRARRAPRESRRVSLAQASGYVQLNQYRLLEPIGQGSYGIVKLAYNEEDDTHYAMKILSKRKLMRRAGLFGRAPPRTQAGPPPDPLQRVYREIAVLKKLDHPNVVKLVEVLDDPAEDQLYLVFQLLEGGPVIDIPTESPLSEQLARKYFRDVLLGVEYLHYQGIAHRDIKPANLLLGEGRVQVADLGACGELAGRLSGAVGTPAFRAPEAAATTHNYAGEAADVWSLGVTLYSMVTGRVPWLGATSVELQRRVLADPLAFPLLNRQPSPVLTHLLARMLDKDPATRATMQEIKEHEWVTAGGSEPLPSELENCRLVEVTDEDMARVVTSIPNLSTLILIKTMLKKHSFQNPFLRSREGSTARRDSAASTRGDADAAADPRSRRGGLLARAGRSLSAPGNYLTERQASFDVALESVQEGRDQNQDAPSSGTTSAVVNESDSQSPGTSRSVSTSLSSEIKSVSTSQSVSITQSTENKSVSRCHSVSENQSVPNSSSISDIHSQASSQDSDNQCDNGKKCVRNSHSFTLNQSESSSKNGNVKTTCTNKMYVRQSDSSSHSVSTKSVSSNQIKKINPCSNRVTHAVGECVSQGVSNDGVIVKVSQTVSSQHKSSQDVSER